MAEQVVKSDDINELYDGLTGTQKCAILMMLLGEDEAAEIMKNLTPKEVQTLGSAMYSVQGLPQETVNLVLDEFLAIIKGQTSLGIEGTSYIKNVLTKALVEGMTIVGIDFRDGILFVPEVLMAANAMKAGMVVLRPLLAETGAPRVGKAVIGTVKGDIHDIGKNLVSMMWEGAGFEVIDIGINNPVENYLEAIEEHKPDILGMSALLTTTMPYMKVVIDTMVEKGIRDDYIVLVGGAPLNEAFSQSIGADAYCRDAAVAVDTAKIFMSKKMNVAKVS